MNTLCVSGVVSNGSILELDTGEKQQSDRVTVPTVAYVRVPPSNDGATSAFSTFSPPTSLLLHFKV